MSNIFFQYLRLVKGFHVSSLGDSDREKSSGQTPSTVFGIGTIEAMDGTVGQAHAKLCLLRTWNTVPEKHKHGRYYE
jgi:hypothetical protein